MLKSFRLLSLIEGLSLLVLLLIAMPLKYQLGYDLAVFYAGMTHGLLWFSYFAMSLLVSHSRKWSVAFWLLVLAASVTPFACFILDRKLKEPETRDELPATA